MKFSFYEFFFSHLSFFSLGCDGRPSRNNVRETVDFGSQFGVILYHRRKATAAGTGDVCHITATVQKQMNTVHSSLPPLYTVQGPSPGNGVSHSCGSSHLNWLNEDAPSETSQRPKIILDLRRLIVEINCQSVCQTHLSSRSHRKYSEFNVHQNAILFWSTRSSGLQQLSVWDKDFSLKKHIIWAIIIVTDVKKNYILKFSGKQKTTFWVR